VQFHFANLREQNRSIDRTVSYFSTKITNPVETAKLTGDAVEITLNPTF